MGAKPARALELARPREPASAGPLLGEQHRVETLARGTPARARPARTGLCTMSCACGRQAARRSRMCAQRCASSSINSTRIEELQHACARRRHARAAASRGRGGGQLQSDDQVADVGAGRAGVHQVAARRQRARRVGPREAARPRPAPRAPTPRTGLGIHQRAGIVASPRRCRRCLPRAAADRRGRRSAARRRAPGAGCGRRGPGAAAAARSTPRPTRTPAPAVRISSCAKRAARRTASVIEAPRRARAP